MTLSDRLWPHRGEPNDAGPLAFMPLVKDAIIRGDRPLQHVGRDRDFKFVGMRRDDENVVASDFDLGRFLAKVTGSHLSNSLRSYTEQLGSGPQSHRLIQPHNGSPIPLIPFGTFTPVDVSRAGAVSSTGRCQPKYSSVS